MSQKISMYFEFYVVDWESSWKVRMMIYGVLFVTVGSQFSDQAQRRTGLGPADPLQWICREWVQKLGSDGAMTYLGTGDDQIGAKNTESDGPTS